MAEINRTEILEKLRKGLRLHPGRDKIPSEVASKIIPVFISNEDEKPDIVASETRTTSGTMTIYTTEADRDFYLCGLTYSYVKDATNDSGTGALSVQTIINGETVQLVNLGILDLTAQQEVIDISLPEPIKLDRSAYIRSLGTFTVGSLVRGCSIRGFYKQPD